MPGNLILAVGNAMLGDDAAGPMLARMLENDPAPGWSVIDGGSAPENHVHRVLAEAPDTVLVVDATDMGLAPGEVRRVDERFIAEQFIMTTHDMPLSFLIERIREVVPEVVFLGIQPDIVSFMFPVTPAVQRAVEDVHARLKKGDALETFECLPPA
ncbi:hydrogenase maturation peptidase HycI [Azospirillum halopraeferens]|uniref:hydrogenase maturation peptidase HycI n=1 Tax=Azospirillum halopraeferens TaxID=34010 RepID=UPI000415F2BE|nr:hydrogenase maturation peptidase HycI [Azospirillum halopraeferens]